MLFYARISQKSQVYTLKEHFLSASFTVIKLYSLIKGIIFFQKSLGNKQYSLFPSDFFIFFK